MRRLFAMLLLSLVVVGCEKEIDLGYRSVDPIYVIESSTTDSGSSVKITKSTDMYSPMNETTYAAQSVQITDQNGVVNDLLREEDGVYRSSTVCVGAVGEQFRLDVTIDGDVYSSTSTVMAPAVIISTGFVVDEVMSTKCLSFAIEAERGDLVERYFRYLIYHSDTFIESGTLKKSADDTGVIGTSIFFAMDESGELTALNPEESEIAAGEDIRVEFFAIDDRAYDYFYSLSLAGTTSSNPDPNFTGGCLGYYCAYYSDTLVEPLIY